MTAACLIEGWPRPSARRHYREWLESFRDAVYEKARAERRAAARGIGLSFLLPARPGPARKMKDYSEPRMHTAEHLLNQAMVRLFGLGRAFSSHIEKKRSKCDFRFSRALTAVETAELERRVNEAVGADLPVREDFVLRAEAAKGLDLGRLPEGAGENLHIIRIGDYDACPCIGRHVKSTGEIGRFRIVSSSFSDGVLRIRFRLAEQAAGQ